MGPSDLNHFSVALQSAVRIFFFYCTVFTILIMFAYVNIKVRLCFVNRAREDTRAHCVEDGN